MYWIIFAGLALIYWALWKLFKRENIIVFEYEQGILYTDGQVQQVCPPGRYRIRPLRQRLEKVDLRRKILTIPAQSILTADQAQIKISLVCEYKIKDVLLHLHETQAAEQQLYLQMQLALRAGLQKRNLDELIQFEASLQEELLNMGTNSLNNLGIELLSLKIKDLMLPADLRKAYAEILSIQKRHEARMEQARSEQASLRKLANAAKQLENNPYLMHLRLLHSIEQSQVAHSIHFPALPEVSSKTQRSQPQSNEADKN